MNPKSSRIPIFCLFFLFAFLQKNCFSDYIEGIDTTDDNGYGLDSTFQITANSITNKWTISGTFNAYYFYLGWGYYNYKFDDIKMAPDSAKQVSSMSRIVDTVHSFVVKKNKDSTYSKLKILKHLAGNQYVYMFGRNTTPNDKMLIKSDYDRSVRYKPNNLFNIYGGYNASDSTTWEPPLQNNNHLLGYIFYRPKSGVIIDTTAPINPAQWDSVSFIDSTCSSQLFPHGIIMPGFYFNLVAVYAEGKSDFLLGWTKYQYDNLKTRPNLSSRNCQNERIVVKKDGEGFLFEVQSFHANMGSSSLSIYNLNGQQIARFAGIKSNSIFWNTSNQDLPEGLYIMKAELPDKSVLSQKFMLSR
jgi:hypothetical protein